jgi:hypothetical protein
MNIILDGRNISHAVAEVSATRGPNDPVRQITLVLLGTVRITGDPDVELTWNIATLSQPAQPEIPTDPRPQEKT